VNVYLTSAIKLDRLGEISLRHQHATNMFGYTVVGWQCYLKDLWKIYTDKVCINNALIKHTSAHVNTILKD